MSASFGVAYASHDSVADDLLRDADAALYRAKARGRGRCELFDAPMRAQAMARLEIETGLRVALGSDQLTLHYQPVVDLASGETLALEALMRWRHPVRGPVSPGEFIPVAEDSGLIVPLGRWALDEACEHAATLGPEGPPVSVNLSARQLATPYDRRTTSPRRSRARGSPPGRLWLELTETALFEEADAPLPVLHELKALGVQLVLDDFGTGYSSLAYLQRFPLDALKIDRAFVSEMTQDARAAALVEAIATMARSLGLTVVPEGIETEAQREALLALGCRYGQGFLFGRPQPAEAPSGPRVAAADLEPPGAELRRDRRVLAEHGVGDEARRAGAERDAPRAVAGGHEQALGGGQRAEQRAAVGADRAGAGAQPDRLGAGEARARSGCRARRARARPRSARAAR